MTYTIHEAYYAKKGDTIPNGWTVEPAFVMSDDRMGLLQILAMMADAVRQPTLEVIDGKIVEVEPERAFTDDLVKAMKAIEIETTP